MGRNGERGMIGRGGERTGIRIRIPLLEILDPALVQKMIKILWKHH